MLSEQSFHFVVSIFLDQDQTMVGGRLVNVDEPALMERHGEIKRPAYIF
jgi:hypothetical protein